MEEETPESRAGQEDLGVGPPPVGLYVFSIQAGALKMPLPMGY